MNRAAAVALLASSFVLSACNKDACEKAPPSVHVDIAAKNGLETQIAAVELIFIAGTNRYRGRYELADRLRDGATSIDILVEPPPAGTFNVDITLRAMDASGREIAEAHASAVAAPNGCNVYALELAAPAIADGGVDSGIDAGEAGDAGADGGGTDAVESDSDPTDGGEPAETGADAEADAMTPPECGNGTLEGGEQCDDRNTVTESCTYGQMSCLVCDSSCNEIAGATSYCGDNAIDSGNGETCDDGNTMNGDGCDSSCAAECPEPLWWDPAYTDRWDLDVSAADGDYTVIAQLTGTDAQEIFSRSQAGGDDLRMLFFDGGSWLEIDRHLIDFSSQNIELAFQIQQQGGHPGGNGVYFIYAGNAVPDPPLDEQSNVYDFFEDFEGFALGSDGTPVFDPLPSADFTVVDDSGNRVYHSDGAGRHTARLAGYTFADGVADIRMKFLSDTFNRGGIALRSPDLSPMTLNSYSCMLGKSFNEAVLARHNGASYTELSGATIPLAIDTWYDMRLVFRGGTIEQFVNGNLTNSINGVNNPGELIGIFGFDPDLYFDDVRVRPLVDPEPTVVKGPLEPRCP